MKGLLVKDWYQLKEIKRLIVVMVLVCFFLFIGNGGEGNSISFIFGYLMIMMSMMAKSGFIAVIIPSAASPESAVAMTFIPSSFHMGREERPSVIAGSSSASIAVRYGASIGRIIRQQVASFSTFQSKLS